MTININTNKAEVKKIRKQIKDTGGFCPYFKSKGKSQLCMCNDIIDAPEGTYCHMKLYKKEIEGDNNK